MEIVLFFLPELKTCNQIKKNIPLLEKLTRIGHLEKVSQDLLYFIICHHIQENLLSVIVLATICCVGPLMPLPVIAVKLNLYCVAGFRPLIL
jgi:hypothetical protein